MKKGVTFERRNNLVQEIVFADGVGRSGKIFLTGPLGCMERVEKQVNPELFENLPILESFGKISRDAVVTLLRTEADTKLYELMISRNVNFRIQDYTGLYKAPDRMKYVKRLFKSDGDDAVRRVLEERPILQVHMHDGLRTVQLLEEAFGDRMKLLYMVRDPVDLIYEWIRSKFGERIGHDLREQQMTITYKGGVVPYTAAGWEEEYLKINPAERVVVLIYNHFTKNLDNYVQLPKKTKKKIFFVSFEEVVADPYPPLEKMAEFLGTRIVHSRLKRVLKRENAPRVLDPKERKRRISSVNRKLSAKYKKLFLELQKKFASKYWLK